MAQRTLCLQPDIELRSCDLNGPEESARAALADAHAYQISAAKDELPRRWFATAELLERCPKLLYVSSIGAGYDTVDVTACTRAGVLVVNQSGANAQAVAVTGPPAAGPQAKSGSTSSSSWLQPLKV